MAKFNFDCNKCTNVFYMNGFLYCKPRVDAYKSGEIFEFKWDWKDGSGKKAEAYCDEFTTISQQMSFYI